MNSKSLFKNLSVALILFIFNAIQSAERSPIEQFYGKSIDKYISPIKEAAALEQASIVTASYFPERLQEINTLRELQDSYEAGERGLANHIKRLNATRADAKKIQDALDDLIKKQEAFIDMNKKGQELIKARIKEMQSANSSATAR